MSDTIELEEAFLEMMEERATRGGATASYGRVLGIFLINDKPMDQEELTKLSKYTKAHVSKVLNQLLIAGVIKKTKESLSTPGRPKLLYSFDKHGFDFVQPGILTNIRSLSHTKDRLLEIRNGTFQGKKIIKTNENPNIMTIVEFYIDYIRKMVNILEEALIKVNKQEKS